MTTLQGLKTKENRDTIIEKNTGIISRVYYKLTGKFLTVHDDEYSIGLMAIDEAAQKYDSKKGTKFSSFCHTVIHGRLIDHLRKRKREIPFSHFEGEGNEAGSLTQVEAKEGIEAYETINRTEILKDEIKELSKVLAEFNIEFSQLPDISPKHRDTRENLIKIARQIIEHEEILNKINNKKVLPMKQIVLLTGVKNKTLERHRRYIIVLVMILSKDFQYLKEYI